MENYFVEYICFSCVQHSVVFRSRLNVARSLKNIFCSRNNHIIVFTNHEKMFLLFVLKNRHPVIYCCGIQSKIFYFSKTFVVIMNIGRSRFHS